MVEGKLSDCYNCGPTERAIRAKNLCTKCYEVDSIRNRFDAKKDLPGAKFVWTAKRIATLRYFRVGLKQKLPTIAAYLGTSVRQCRLACKRYGIHKNSRGPYTK